MLQQDHFHSLLSHFEELLVSNEFTTLQSKFLNKNYHYFTHSITIKYTPLQIELHEQYIQTVKSFLSIHFIEFNTSFNLFDEKCREMDVVGDVMDVLNSLNDITEFRELMLAYRDEMDGVNNFMDVLNVDKYELK